MAVRAPTIPAEKQRILWALVIACVVLAVGAAVVGSASYPSLASSSAALVNPTTPLGASYPLFDDAAYNDDDGVGDNQPAAVWGLILAMGALLGRLLWILYNERPKLHSIFNPPLEQPG
jgi:hypothetical protein